MNRWAPLLAALALAGCGGDSEGSAPAPTGGAGTATGTTAPPETGADGAATVRCANAEGGFTVAYPEGWHEERCAYFDPERFELEPATEAPRVAVAIRREPVPIDVVAGESPTREVISREDVTVAERDAVRLEVESTGEGLLPAGERTTFVLVPVDGETIVASTPDAGDAFERMVESLELVSDGP